MALTLQVVGKMTIKAAGHTITLKPQTVLECVASLICLNRGPLTDAALAQFGSTLYTAQLAKTNDSGHYAVSREKRQEIVEMFRKDRYLGKVANQEQWAEAHGTTARNLYNWRKEFPEN